MLKMIKRILVFIALILTYFVVKEFLILYTLCRNLHPWAGYGFLVAVIAFSIYFIVIPLFDILRLPRRFEPTRDPNQIQPILEARIKTFSKNKYLLDVGFDLNHSRDPQSVYDQAIKILGQASERIRQKYVTQLFYTTAIAQNGFLDALLIFSYSVNMVKEIFRLYHGRVSNKAVFRIAKMVYFSMAIGGSEGVEYAADEIISKVSTGTIKKLPFASKILGSVADGFINAALLTRISLITEKYCTLVFMESNRALYPSYKTVVETTRILTQDMIDRIFAEMKKLANDKTSQIKTAALNPVNYVLERTVIKWSEREEHGGDDQASMRSVSSGMKRPGRFIIARLTHIFRK